MERVLVCILAQTRAHQVAWPSFKRHVLDELSADLALAVTIDEEYDYTNPYWQHAKYHWAAAEPDDVGDAFDLALRWLRNRDDAAPPDWRSMLRIKGIWQGGIQSPDPQPTRTALSALFSRWLLLHGLQQDGILDHYDRFVVTRSDFVWLCPHPPMSVLDRESIWIPDGEHWGGLCDRHLVVSRDNAPDALNLIDDILLRPEELYEELKDVPDLNAERFLKYHLTRKGLLSSVKMFPYVMYTARPVRDPQSRGSWSPRAQYHPSVGHIVKYEGELRSARAYASVISTREDWETGAWRRFDAKSVADHYRPSAVELVWFPIRKVVSALRRPGRMARFNRYRRHRRSKKFNFTGAVAADSDRPGDAKRS